MMHAGMLYDRVSIEAPTNNPDGYGGTINGWTEALICRAHIMFLRGGEAVIASRLQGRQPVVIYVRANTTTEMIEPSWRIVDERTTVVYNVRSVVRSQDRRWMELTAESGVPT